MPHTAARTLMEPSSRTLGETLFCETTWRHRAVNCSFQSLLSKDKKNFKKTEKFGPFLKINYAFYAV
jgi:hypothetical protein